MDKAEQTAVLQLVVRILSDNGGNRITEALINGVSITLRQATDSMVVVDPPTVADNKAKEKAAKVKKE